MKISIIPYALLLLANLNFVQAQTQSSESIQDILNSFSKESWEKDSLGNNGYRHGLLKRFEAARIGTVSKEMLISKMGKPSEIKNTTCGPDGRRVVWFWYYLCDVDIYRRNPIFDHPYMHFTFDWQTGRLEKIEKGFLCF